MRRGQPSRRVHIRVASLLAVAASAAQAIAAESTPVTQAHAPPEAGGLQEIVVTARKREESLQDVPVSVVAASGAELEQRSIQNLAKLGTSTPNFRFSEQPQTGRTGGVVFIRGVGQRDPIAAYDPAVGIYVDGVYLGRMFANNIDTLEVERIEVLRGPQGTLFGKNTSGGAVNILTRRPDTAADSFGGRIAATTGQFSRFDLTGNVNVPLVADRLALQISASRLTQDGFAHRMDGADMSDTDRWSTRAQMLYQATERFSVLFGADYFSSREANAAFRLVDTNPSVPPIAALNAFTAERYDDRWVSPTPYFFNATGPNQADNILRGTALTLSWEGGWGTLKSISSYRDQDVISNEDPDGSPVEEINSFQHSLQHQFSQELQAGGTSLESRLDWTVGAFFFREVSQSHENYDLLTPLFGGGADFSRRSNIENTSKAIYGQGVYALTDRLRLTAGLRYTDDVKHLQTLQFDAAGATTLETPNGEHASTAVSPRVGLDYRWTPHFMTYVSAAQGAKNGGFNGRVSRLVDFLEFEDEKVWTYEVGLRSDLLNERLRVNATAFFSDYEDLQLQISGSTVINGAPAPFNIIANIPQAKIHGGELEITALPGERLTLTAGLGLTYGKYSQLPEDPQFVASGIITRDSKFSNMPEVSATLGAQYTVQLSGSVQMTARADYAYQCKIYYNAENSPNVVQPGYGLLDARVTVEHAPSSVSVALFGTNLTNKVYFVGGFDDAANRNPGLGFSIVNMGAPRQWGLTLQKRF